MDTVADSLIRIKNGYLSLKKDVVLPYSKLVGNVCEVLKKEEYIADVKQQTNSKNENIKEYLVTLRYNNRKAAVTDVKRISKPGLRVYKSKKMLPYVINGLGIAIISTPKGVMTDKQARKEGVGGEILAYVW
jgi:small subunit ribosomal protein S8